MKREMIKDRTRKLSLTAGLGIGLSASAGLAAPHAASAAVAAPVGASVKAALQKLYAAEDAAAKRKDVDGMFTYFAPSFTNVDIHGQRSDLATFRGELSQLTLAAQSVAPHSVVRSVAVQGKTAVATLDQRVAIVVIDHRSGAPIRLGVHAVSRDTWTRTAAGWRETSSRTTSENDTLNGKPIDMNAPPPPPPAAPAEPPAPPAAPSPPPPPPPPPAAPAAPAPPVSVTGE